MDTRKPVDLRGLKQSVSIAKLKSILEEFRKQGLSSVYTADVIRAYAGHFLKNTGMPAALSFNANFGKILKANSQSLHISEVRSGVSIRDDAGETTSSSKWRI